MLDYTPRDYRYPALPYTAIKWARYRLPGGILWDRDFVFLEHNDTCEWKGQKVGYGVGESVEMPQVPILVALCDQGVSVTHASEEHL